MPVPQHEMRMQQHNALLAWHATLQSTCTACRRDAFTWSICILHQPVLLQEPSKTEFCSHLLEQL